MARKRKRRGGRNNGNNNANDTQRLLAENLEMQTRILALLEYGEERRQLRPRRAVLTPRPDLSQAELPIPPPPPLTAFPPTTPELIYQVEEQQQREAYLHHMDQQFVNMLSETIRAMRQQRAYATEAV